MKVKVKMTNVKTGDILVREINDDKPSYLNKKDRDNVEKFLTRQWIEYGKIIEEDGKILDFAKGYNREAFEEEITKFLKNAEKENYLIKAIVRGWARKMIREKWIEEKRIIVFDSNEEFADGYTSEMLKNDILEFEKDVVWEIEA